MNFKLSVGNYDVICACALTHVNQNYSGRLPFSAGIILLHSFLHNSWGTRNVSTLPSLTLEHKWCIYPFFIHFGAQVVNHFSSLNLEHKCCIYPSFIHLGIQGACLPFLHSPWCTSGMCVLLLYTLERKWHNLSFSHKSWSSVGVSTLPSFSLKHKWHIYPSSFTLEHKWRKVPSFTHHPIRPSNCTKHPSNHPSNCPIHLSKRPCNRPKHPTKPTFRLFIYMSSHAFFSQALHF